MKANLANILTFSRMMLAVPAVFFLLKDGPHYHLLALLFFSAASVTDFLDGYAARVQGTVSEFGGKLDPFADKVLVISAMLGFAVLGQVPLWMVIVMIARDVVVTILRSRSARKFAPGILAKSKTALQMSAVVFLMLMRWLGAGNGTFRGIIYPVMLGVTVITVASGLEYVFRRS
ncbi:hypothetical protein AUJ67_04160 [Candidatus Desantisbacteria bacterium CG1_02_49_89]|nr:MAG: hypothetical protein AUJ67_04160 [Candidatus Desantisbacteria bacterium CG1_02_49_89]